MWDFEIQASQQAGKFGWVIVNKDNEHFSKREFNCYITSNAKGILYIYKLINKDLAREKQKGKILKVAIVTHVLERASEKKNKKRKNGTMMIGSRKRKRESVVNERRGERVGVDVEGK